MTPVVQDFLTTFDRLTDSERLDLASEILKRTAYLDFPPLSLGFKDSDEEDDELNWKSRAIHQQKRQRNDLMSIRHNARNHLLTRSITPPIEAATLSLIRIPKSRAYGCFA